MLCANLLKPPPLTQNRKVGDPFKPDTKHGPQINSKQLEKIQEYVEEVSGADRRGSVMGRRHLDTPTAEFAVTALY